MKKKITAVIPLRQNSQRIIRKNLRPFGGTTLLHIKIERMKKVNGIDNIIVNTNSDEAIKIAMKLGVGFHKREDYYASSDCSGSEFFEYLGKVTDTDIFAYCPVTSPLIEKQTMEKAIEIFLNECDNYDCLSTVSCIKKFLWYDGQALNYIPTNAPNSQDLPDIYALNFGFTLIHRQDLINNKNIIGKKPFFIPITDIESIDIDTPLDFFIAEQIYIKTQIKSELLIPTI